jgi:hypothetical protein
VNSDPLYWISNEMGYGAREDNFLADSGSTCERAPTKQRILTAQGNHTMHDPPTDVNIPLDGIPESGIRQARLVLVVSEVCAAQSNAGRVREVRTRGEDRFAGRTAPVLPWECRKRQ